MMMVNQGKNQGFMFKVNRQKTKSNLVMPYKNC